MKRVLILGGKGTGSVVGHCIMHAISLGYKEYEFSGFVNDFDDEIDGFPVMGKFKDVNKLISEGYYFINTVYKIGGQNERIELFENLEIPDENLCTFIHPFAYVAPSVVLNPGCVVLANASISPQTKIGRCCVIMSNVSIGHDNEIGNYNFIAANSCLGSYIKVGIGSWLGLNCTIRGKLIIGKKAAVGIGAVVTKNIGDEEIWVGNPARFYKSVYEEISI